MSKSCMEYYEIDQYIYLCTRLFITRMYLIGCQLFFINSILFLGVLILKLFQ